MKSLKTIQTLAKIGKVISKIVYICCMIGFIACAVGTVAIAIGGNAITLNETTTSIGTTVASLVAGLILCTGEYVVARMAYRYFDNELTAGTPFTFEGAKEMMHLGISVIWITVVSSILAQVAQAIISAIMKNVDALTLDCGVSVAMGVMLIVMSLFCRYGAELMKNQAETGSDEQN